MMSVALESSLVERWSSLVNDSVIDEINGKILFGMLLDAYSEPHRHYHNLSHIQQMLGLLEAASISAVQAHWATWFHDAVYQPGQSDNEMLSAKLAEQSLLASGVSAEVVGETVKIIRATKHHQTESLDPTILAVLDADMAILGVQPSEYSLYRASVRAEFGYLPELLFKQGRRRFLKRVLEQPRIYQTEWFYLRFEEQARLNLSRELAS